MKELLLEGGVAGHLAHLYDNRGLTFEKMAEVLTAASRGQLAGTEKTDGFNVYLGFKNGHARAARNKAYSFAAVSPRRVPRSIFREIAKKVT